MGHTRTFGNDADGEVGRAATTGAAALGWWRICAGPVGCSGGESTCCATFTPHPIRPSTIHLRPRLFRKARWIKIQIIGKCTNYARYHSSFIIRSHTLQTRGCTLGKELRSR